MGLLDGLEMRDKTAAPKKATTFDDVVKNAIEDQIKIADGQMLKGNVSKDGVQLYKMSWYSEYSQSVSPKVWIKQVFPGKEIPMSFEQYKTWIKSVKENWQTDPDFSKAIDVIRADYDKQYKKG